MMNDPHDAPGPVDDRVAALEAHTDSLSRRLVRMERACEQAASLQAGGIALARALLSHFSERRHQPLLDSECRLRDTAKALIDESERA